jgi:hypothetical protein
MDFGDYWAGVIAALSARSDALMAEMDYTTQIAASSSP